MPFGVQHTRHLIKTLQNWIEYGFVLALAAIIRLLPEQTAMYSGELFGRFIYRWIPIRKKVAIDNLALAFPDKSETEINEIAQSTYINFAKTIFEFARFPRMSQNISQKVCIVNEHILKQVFDQGKGTICVSGHFGNWELMAAAIRELGYPMVGIAKEQRNHHIDRLISDFRQCVGVRTIRLGMALRGVLHALKKNDFVALLTDQDAHDEGVFVEFLGRPSSTAVGPAVFALKNQSPMIFGAAIREKDNHHRIFLEKVQTDDLDGLSEESIGLLTQRHTNCLDYYVRQYPDHWFWMHKRWKTKPKSESRIIVNAQ